MVVCFVRSSVYTGYTVHIQTSLSLCPSQKQLKLDAETRAFFETLMTAVTRPEQKNLRLLIEDQLKILRSKNGRCKWHTAVLNWCTDVYRRNPGAYEHMALGGFLKLPDKDTCRKRAARVQATSCESKELMAKLKARVADLPAERREMALLFDEVNILGDIGWGGTPRGPQCRRLRHTRAERRYGGSWQEGGARAASPPLQGLTPPARRPRAAGAPWEARARAARVQTAGEDLVVGGWWWQQLRITSGWLPLIGGSI